MDKIEEKILAKLTEKISGLSIEEFEKHVDESSSGELESFLKNNCLSLEMRGFDINDHIFTGSLDKYQISEKLLSKSNSDDYFFVEGDLSWELLAA